MSNIKKIDIGTAMKIKYVDYALSVICGRALPDVRDGLKWVHRRSIFSMYELGLMPDKGYRKCARIVGDVLGKYHPHGDTAVYDAIVRLAQDFSMRYTLVDGHGNFGSVDGDPAAAYRYTEAKMEKLTLEILRDINKNVVDFIPNFDGEEREPTIMPSRFPNFLVNGSEGIAVGVATSVPPHNLNEVIDGIIYLIDNNECSIEDLIKIIKAPDFPTRATILNPQDMISVYSNGYGKIIMRAKYHFEENKNKTNIIVTEIPYQINKAKLVETIYYLSRDSTKTTTVIKNGKKIKVEETIKAKIPQIEEVLDESDREGMRINIKLKKNINANKVLPLLFKYSDLQCNYNANFTAIYGTNQLLEHLNLKQILQYYINHQKEVLTRRTQFDLDKSLKRLHILEGLRIAILNMDKAIELIRASKSKNEAKEKLISNLSLDEEQSNAVLKLELQRLTGLEIETIQSEYSKLIKNVEYLKSILNNEYKLLEVLKEELIEIRDKYGDERRTKLVYEDNIQNITTEDLVENYTVTLCLTKENYIKKNLKYSETQKLKDEDEILQLFQTTNKTDLLLFTSQGRLFIRKTYELEECQPSAYGTFISNWLGENLPENEKIIYICTTKNYKENMLFIFENGNIAKTKLKAYKTKTNRQVAQTAYNTESKLIGIGLTEKDVDVFMISEEGKGTIIDSSILKAKGKNIQGNSSMKLENEYKVISAIVNPKEDLWFNIKTEKGKNREFRLDAIAETSQSEKSWYEYLRGSGSLNRTGNFILNCRNNNDKIVKVTINK